MTSDVRYEVADEVATVTLNRPDLRNRMTVDMLNELLQVLRQAAHDDAVRVVVLTGEGNTFCAGADLGGASAANSDNAKWDGPRAIVDVLTTLMDHPKPTVARVQGHVAGGGNGLVAACDLAIAVESARFAYSEVRLGVAPAVISVACIRKMAVADAYELLLTGERVSAQRVLRAGLINEVVADDGLDGAVNTLVNKLRAGGPNALEATKQLLRRVPTMNRDDAFEWTADMSATLFSSQEASTGMAAFLNKEKAPWAP